jgi:hypothetical protein
VKDPQKALGMNLLGTLVGGALEYMSMILGIAALNLVALVLYGLAFWCYKRHERSESSDAEPAPVIETSTSSEPPASPDASASNA